MNYCCVKVCIFSKISDLFHKSKNVLSISLDQLLLLVIQQNKIFSSIQKTYTGAGRQRDIPVDGCVWVAVRGSCWEEFTQS